MSKDGKGEISQTKAAQDKLCLPDLDHSKSAVLDSLRSPESKRGYRHAIDEFIQWYCSEPRLSFNKTVVTRYRIFLENRQLAAGTINVRLAAVRRLAYEAADAGLLSPELAAGIRRVKGAKKLGVRLGNWITGEEARRFWQSPDCQLAQRKAGSGRPSCTDSDTQLQQLVKLLVWQMLDQLCKHRAARVHAAFLLLWSAASKPGRHPRTIAYRSRRENRLSHKKSTA